MQGGLEATHLSRQRLSDGGASAACCRIAHYPRCATECTGTVPEVPVLKLEPALVRPQLSQSGIAAEARCCGLDLQRFAVQPRNGRQPTGAGHGQVPTSGLGDRTSALSGVPSYLPRSACRSLLENRTRKPRMGRRQDARVEAAGAHPITLTSFPSA